MTENLEERGFGQKEMGFVQVEHPFKETVRMFATNYAAVAGFVVLVIIVLVSLLGPFIYTTDPWEMVWSPGKQPPPPPSPQ